jgi:threonine synthase
MRRVYGEHGMLLDPHTAVGVLAARRVWKALGGEVSVITLATAHPGKFLEIVRETTGVEPPLPESLKTALALPKRSTLLQPSLERLREFLRERFR